MTRFMRWGLILSLTPVAFALQAWAQPFPHDIQRILQNQKIVVAMVAADNFPRLATGTNERPQEFEARLARNIAQAFGVKAEFVRTSPTFDGVIRQVADKQADLGISLLTITPHRAKMVYFSTPYLTMHLALLVNRRQRLLEQEKFPHQDIRNTTACIGVVRGSSNVLLAQKNFRRATLKEYDSFAAELAAVQKGKCFALLDDDIIIKRFLKENPSAAVNLEIDVLQDLPDFVGIAVRPDSPHLLAWINVFLMTQGIHFTSDELLNKLK
ncbi:MAG: ABC transporter substrate-binding protein [Deltaproteobacteria bacterium]|jgi:polar amino acid transport system substrate-binding protein